MRGRRKCTKIVLNFTAGDKCIMTRSVSARAAAALLLVGAFFISGCGKSPVRSAEDVPLYTVGAAEFTSGAAYAELMRKQGTEVVLYPDTMALTAGLISGGVDCILADEEEAKLCKKMSGRLKVLDDPLAEDGFRIAVALEMPDLLELIDGALTALSNEGLLRSASQSWFHDRSFSGDWAKEGTFEHTLTVAVDTRMKPYAYYDDTGALVGLDVDVARMIACRAGFNVEFIHVDQGDLLDAVRKGNADFAMGALFETEENSTLVRFSQVYVQVTELILVRKR